VIKVKYKELEMVLGGELEAMLSQRQNDNDIEIDVKSNKSKVQNKYGNHANTHDKYISRAEEYRTINPKASITSAYRGLFAVITKIIDMRRPDLLISSQSRIKALGTINILSIEDFKFIEEAYKFGAKNNSMLIGDETVPTSEEAINYISLVKKAIKRLDKFMNKETDA
jgi:hypothetical protein